MNINLNLTRILIALLVALIAVGFYLLCADVLKWPVWACLWAFGFVLLALNASITIG